MTAADLVNLLRNHYLPPGRVAAGLFAEEVGSPCGRRRADALWVPTTAHGDPGIVGHEVKVSRADVLVELADPAKADPWAKYCDRWWLVVGDPKLIDGLDIPDAWGVMAPPSGRLRRTMTVLRPAPKLNPLNPTPGFRRLVAWQMYGIGGRLENAEANLRNEQRTNERLRKELQELRISGAGPSLSQEHLRLHRVIERAKQRIRQEGLWLLNTRIDGGELDDLVVDALVDAAVTREAALRSRQDVQSFIERMEQELDPLRHARELLASAIKLGLPENDR